MRFLRARFEFVWVSADRDGSSANLHRLVLTIRSRLVFDNEHKTPDELGLCESA